MLYLLFFPIILSALILWPTWLFGHDYFVTNFCRILLMLIVMNEMESHGGYWNYYGLIMCLITSIACIYGYDFFSKKHKQKVD